MLFDGIRVGEITRLGLVADSPQQVDATIAVTSGTPVHADTKVGLDFQGLTGVPVIALEGGKQNGASTATQTLVAHPTAGQSRRRRRGMRWRASIPCSQTMRSR